MTTETDDNLLALIKTHDRINALYLDAINVADTVQFAGQDAKFLQARADTLDDEMMAVYDAVEKSPARTMAGVLAKLDFAGVPPEDHYMVAVAREDLRLMVGPEVGGDPRPLNDPDMLA